MTLYSQEKKGTRYGKQQERNCKIIIAGRCGSTTTSNNAASESNTRKTEFDESRVTQISVNEEKKRTVQLHHKNKQNCEDSCVVWAGNVNRQVHNTALRQDFNVPESQATVQDMIEANRLLPQVKKDSGSVIRIFSFPTEEQLTLIGWSDAALQNCLDEGSTKGLLFTFSSVMALQGEESLMSVISWRSGRIDRVCRSATCAETREIVDLEDELFSLRYQRSEKLCNGKFTR